MARLQRPVLALALTAVLGGLTPLFGQEEAAGSGAGETETEVLMDLWVGFYIGDAKVRYAQAKAELVQDDSGRELIRLDERHWVQRGSRLQRQVFKTSLHHTFWMRPDDLGIVRYSAVETERTRESHTSVEASDDGKTLTLKTWLVDVRSGKRISESEPQSFPAPGPVVGSNDLLMKRLFDEGKLVPGFEHTFYELDTSVPEAHAKTLRVTSVDEETGQIEVAFDVVKLVLDSRGWLEEGFYGDLRVVAEPEELARDFGGKVFAAYDELDLDYLVPAMPGIEGVIAEITVEGDPRGDVFQDADYQKVLDVTRTEERTVYRVLLEVYDDRPAAPVPFPLELTDAEREELDVYLRPTTLIQSNEPTIRELARKTVGDTDDAYEAVRLLQRKVSSSLMQDYTEIAGLSAIEALEQGRGDCAEHAVVFNALARSLGIPTRQCSGYVFWGTRGGRHAWSQVKLGDHWVHVDCVGRLLEAGPQYIQFWSESQDGSVDRDLGRRQHVLSTCPADVRVTGFRKDGRDIALSPDAKRGRFVDGDTYRNPFSGLTIARPEGWRWRQSGVRSTNGIKLVRTGAGAPLEVTVEVEPRSRDAVLRGFEWRQRYRQRDVEGPEAPAGDPVLAAEMAGLEGEQVVSGTGAVRGELWVGQMSRGCLKVIVDGDASEAGDALRALQAKITLE